MHNIYMIIESANIFVVKEKCQDSANTTMVVTEFKEIGIRG